MDRPGVAADRPGEAEPFGGLHLLLERDAHALRRARPREDRETRERRFTFRKGPVFVNVLLADEINRTPPKTQAALLEAMAEGQVTTGGARHELPRPFFVLATQNPIEQEGTYPLPEAQMDRFMLKVMVNYPNRDQELLILERMSKTRQDIPVRPVTTPDEILAARALVDEIYVDRKVQEYIVDLVMATRRPKAYGLMLDELIHYGASPRATIFLTLAAKANAFLHGRGHVVPQDVKDLALDSFNWPGSAALACAATRAKAVLSRAARSASIFRSMMMPAAFIPRMSCE